MSTLADQPVNVIGMGMSPLDLTAQHLGLIQEADLVIGGRRLLDGVDTGAARKVELMY